MPDGQAGCILVRALEPLAGMEAMAAARGLENLNLDSARDLRKLASGPGRLCKALGITRLRDNGKDMVSPESDLQVLDDGFHQAKVLVTRRIGISKSAGMPLRYVIAGNSFHSGSISLDSGLK